MIDQDIIDIFDNYYSPKIIEIKHHGNQIDIYFDPDAQDWQTESFGNKTIDFMWKNGYRVLFWNFGDKINTINFVKNTLEDNGKVKI